MTTRPLEPRSPPTGRASIPDGLLEHLKSQGIHAVFHYVPLHSSPMGRTFGYKEGDLPVTEDQSARLVRLPFYYEISEEEQSRVAEQVRVACEQAARTRRPMQPVA